MAVGILNYGYHDLTYPLHNGHPWGLCPRVGAQEQLSCPLPHQDQEEHGLHKSPGLPHFQGEQAGREMGRGAAVGQTGLQRRVHEEG